MIGQTFSRLTVMLAAGRDQKLTDDQIFAIRNDPRPQAQIARDYSVRQQHVSRIKRGERRAHIFQEQSQ